MDSAFIEQSWLYQHFQNVKFLRYVVFNLDNKFITTENQKTSGTGHNNYNIIDCDFTPKVGESEIIQMDPNLGMHKLDRLDGWPCQSTMMHQCSGTGERAVQCCVVHQWDSGKCRAVQCSAG